MTTRSVIQQEFEATESTGASRWFPTTSATVATLQADITNVGGAWDGLVLDVEVSNDGINGYSLPQPVTLSAAGVTEPFDIDWAFVRVAISTVSGTASTLVTVSLALAGDS